MKWVRDRSRRVQWRPYYSQQEIDVHCQDVAMEFLREKNGHVEFPISTDDLTVLIEQSVSELDLYANLSAEGRDVEGVTEFHRKEKPSVRVARYLSTDPSRENRLRSTLAHEYGHVMFHGFVWNMDPTRKPSMPKRRRPPRCRRARIIAAPQTDWMEWQAGYAGGALLMPVTPVRQLVAEAFSEGVARRVEPGTENHGELVERAAEAFGVSKDAAKLRLLRLGFVAAAASKQYNWT